MSASPVFLSSKKLEAELSPGNWTEIPDVQIGVTIIRGIPGTSPRDRVAPTGTMTLTLDNSTNNSQGKLGLYSPNNVNVLTGWSIGIGIRYSVSYAELVDERLFVGSIAAITPSSGKYGARKVKVSCVDWMDEAALARVKGLALQIDKRSDEIFAVILAAVERQPTASFIQVGGDTYPYALDNALEETGVMTEFQRLAQSEMAIIYVARDGTLVFEGRHKRPNLLYLNESLDDNDTIHVGAGRGRESIVNRAEVQAHPRRIDSAATSALFILASVPLIERITSRVFKGLYRDPDARATRTGGESLIQPVATTDYTFNADEDGGGADLTAQLDVSAVYDANSAEITVLNNGPLDGYLTKLQCRGKGIYSYETILVIADSQASKDLYGESVFPLDMAYQSEIDIAKDAADYTVNLYKAVLTPVDSVTFVANQEDRLLRSAIQLDVSSKIHVEETVIGTEPLIPVGETEEIAALDFFINGVKLNIGEVVICTWILAPADPYSYWILERDGFTELGETTRLAYGAFVPGWVLDDSELGTDTRVNA